MALMPWQAIRPDFAASNALADRSARMMGSSISNIGDRMIAQSGFNKERNTGEELAGINALDSLDALSANKGGILSGLKGKNVDRAAIVAALTQRRSDLQANDQFNYDARMRDTLESRSAQSHKATMANLGLDQTIKGQQIAATKRNVNTTDILKNNYPEMLEANTSLDKDNRPFFDSGKSAQVAKDYGVAVGDWKTALNTGFQYPEHQANVEAEREVLAAEAEDNRKLAQMYDQNQMLDPTEFDDWSSQYINRLESMGISLETDTGEQNKMRNLIDEFKTKIPLRLLQRELAASVDDDNIPRTGLRAVIPFFGMNKIRARLNKLALEQEGKRVARPNPYRPQE